MSVLSQDSKRLVFLKTSSFRIRVPFLGEGVLSLRKKLAGHLTALRRYVQSLLRLSGLCLKPAGTLHCPDSLFPTQAS